MGEVNMMECSPCDSWYGVAHLVLHPGCALGSCDTVLTSAPTSTNGPRMISVTLAEEAFAHSAASTTTSFEEGTPNRTGSIIHQWRHQLELRFCHAAFDHRCASQHNDCGGCR